MPVVMVPMSRASEFDLWGGGALVTPCTRHMLGAHQDRIAS